MEDNDATNRSPVPGALLEYRGPDRWIERGIEFMNRRLSLILFTVLLVGGGLGIGFLTAPGPLPSGTGDPILRLRLDRPAAIAEAAPHFIPHGATYLLRQCGECLASGIPTALKGAIIGIE